MAEVKSEQKKAAKKAKGAKKQHVITEEDEDKAAMEYSIGLAEKSEDKPVKKAEEDEDEDIGHLDIADQILNK